jgi:VID27 PH-like domain
MSWNQLSPRGVQQSYCIRFDDMEAFERFKEAFAQCQYEMLHDVSWDKVKVCISYDNDDVCISEFIINTSLTSNNMRYDHMTKILRWQTEQPMMRRTRRKLHQSWMSRKVSSSCKFEHKDTWLTAL